MTPAKKKNQIVKSAQWCNLPMLWSSLFASIVVVTRRLTGSRVSTVRPLTHNFLHVFFPPPYFVCRYPPPAWQLRQEEPWLGFTAIVGRGLGGGPSPSCCRCSILHFILLGALNSPLHWTGLCSLSAHTHRHKSISWMKYGKDDSLVCFTSSLMGLWNDGSFVFEKGFKAALGKSSLSCKQPGLTQ